MDGLDDAVVAVGAHAVATGEGVEGEAQAHVAGGRGVLEGGRGQVSMPCSPSRAECNGIPTTAAGGGDGLGGGLSGGSGVGGFLTFLVLPLLLPLYFVCLWVIEFVNVWLVFFWCWP